MNLIEAIKSGRPFRIKGRSTWFVATADQTVFEVECGDIRMEFSPREVVSDDWEIQVPKMGPTELLNHIKRIAYEVWLPAFYGPDDTKWPNDLTRDVDAFYAGYRYGNGEIDTEASE